MSVWWLVLAIVVAGVLTARRWLPDAATVADTAYDAYRGLVPPARPSVRVVTKRVAGACRRARVVMPFGQKAVLPRSFVVDLHPEEYAAVAPLRDTVQEVVAASLIRTARAKQWTCVEHPQVRLRSSDQVAEGRPQVTSSTLPSPDSAQLATKADPTRRLAEPSRAAPDVAPEPTATQPGAEPPSASDAEPTTAHGAEATSVSEPIVALRVHRLSSPGGDPRLVVQDRPVTVGRDPECTVRVDYPSASRRHFRLVPTAAGCRIEDLGSRHGTVVNGRRVSTPTVLHPHDTVQIGAQGPLWIYGASVGSSAAAPYRAHQAGSPRRRDGATIEAG